MRLHEAELASAALGVDLQPAAHMVDLGMDPWPFLTGTWEVRATALAVAREARRIRDLRGGWQ